MKWRRDDAGSPFGTDWLGSTADYYFLDYQFDFAVHPDGTIYMVQTQGDRTSDAAETYIVALDGDTGVTKFQVKLPRSSFLRINDYVGPRQECDPPLPDGTVLCHLASFQPGGYQVFSNYSETVPNIGPPLITADGAFYIQVITYHETLMVFPDNPPPISISDDHHIDLLRIMPDGASSIINVNRFTGSITTQTGGRAPGIPSSLQNGELVPDDNTGVITSWHQYPPANSGADTRVYVKHLPAPAANGNGNIFTLPLAGINELVVGENGRAFAQGTCENHSFNVCFSNVVAFDFNSGSVFWDYPSSEDIVQLVAATADGGVVAKEGPYIRGNTFQDPNQVFRLDANGNHSLAPVSATSLNQIILLAPGLDYLGTDGALIDIATAVDFAKSGSATRNFDRSGYPIFDLEIHWLPDDQFFWEDESVDPASRTMDPLSPSEISAIKNDAMTAVKKALPYQGTRVGEGGQSRDIFQFERLTQMQGGNIVFGQTNPFCTFNSACAPSTIWYQPHLDLAQLVIQDAQHHNTQSRNYYVHAIGRGIGRTVAHEFAHRYGLTGMDQGPPDEYNSGAAGTVAMKPWFALPDLKWSLSLQQQLVRLFSNGNPNP